METKRVKVVVSVLALALLQLFSLSSLAQDEPRMPISSVPLVISSPGSYYFTGDLTSTVPNQNAIEVDTNNVTIDLMGYSLVGTGSGITPGSGSGRGIYINARGNVEIRNGTIRHFGGEGIYDPGIAGPEDHPHYGWGHCVIGVRVLINGSDGICLHGFDHLIKDCTVIGNGYCGVYLDQGSMATGNVISENTVDGLVAEYGCTVSGNTVYMNYNNGIAAGSGCTVSGNTAALNGFQGISAWDGCNVIDNTAYGNTHGIYLSGDGNLVKRNTLRDNIESNIEVDGDYNTIEENSATASKRGINFTQNASDNLYADNRALGSNTVCDYCNTGGQINGGGNL